MRDGCGWVERVRGYWFLLAREGLVRRFFEERLKFLGGSFFEE